MKNKIEINLMYSEVRLVTAKTNIAKFYWAVKHDLTLLVGKALKLV